MSLDRIKQNAQIIIESLYRYESLEHQKSQEKNKNKLKEIEQEIKNIKKYITRFSSEIKTLTQQEKLNVHKDAR
jgi:hypothetical protein|tara:strand:+ start:1596 stop:1817 length:222 start_codon:yes stop_codon:yes gene_type:complete